MPHPTIPRALLGALCGFAALGLTGCQWALLDPGGPVGQAEKIILIDSLAIMLAIVVPTIVATLGFAWWFRASNPRAKYRPDWSFSGQIELVVWSIPVMVIILLGGVTWIGAHALEPSKPLDSQIPPLKVQVVSLDWKWLFIYPEQGVASVNRLVVPAGVPLHFSLTSASVMNAFFIPRLGSMIYTMNGMTTQLNLLADEPGTFLGLSSHYSGDGFSDMNFEVHALGADAFAQWAREARGNGPTLDTSAYKALAIPSIAVPPAMFGSVEPKLFGDIVSLRISPAPGPATDKAGH